MDRWEMLSGVGMVVTLFLPLAIVLAGSKYWREAQEKERQRRLTDARMNAILLRLDI